MPTPTDRLIADIADSYDEVTYGSPAHRHAHPVRIASAAAFRGLPYAAPGRCRVLEIGCAEGGHLLPLADAYPDSEFVGIDLSPRQVALATAAIGAAGLDNVQVHCLDLQDLDGEFGRFDYVIAHGVYSWVPPAVRDRLMGVCAQRLAPHGLAYVSYNTYPGWQVAGVLRQMILGQLPADMPLAQRVTAARSIADDVGRRVDHDSPYGSLLLQAAAQVATADDGYLAHEFLEKVNDPVPLTQFVQHAAAHGLHYVDDLAVRTELPPGDIAHQQYADLLHGTPFRAAVLGALLPALDGTIDDDGVRALVTSMYAVGDVTPAGDAADGGGGDGGSGATAFETRKGRLAARSHVLAALLTEVGRQFPACIPVVELVGDDRDALEGLYALHRRGAVELVVEPFPLGTVVGTLPCVPVTVRLQAERGSVVANAALDRHALDEPDQRLVPLLDGTRTVERLAGDLDLPVTEVTRRLEHFARIGLYAPA